MTATACSQVTWKKTKVNEWSWVYSSPVGRQENRRQDRQHLVAMRQGQEALLWKGKDLMVIGLRVSGSHEPPQKGRQLGPKNQSQLLCFESEAKGVDEQGKDLHIFYSLLQHHCLQTNFPVPRLLLSSFLSSQPSLNSQRNVSNIYQTPSLSSH